jgi:hypothetical protein
MSEGEETVLICTPASVGAEIISGSIRDHCHECSQAIWVAPTGQQLKRNGARTLCVPCGLREMEEQETMVVSVLPEQIEEVRRHLGGEA